MVIETKKCVSTSRATGETILSEQRSGHATKKGYNKLVRDRIPKVIYAAANARGVTPALLEKIRARKAQERGAFDKKILLIETETHIR